MRKLLTIIVAVLLLSCTSTKTYEDVSAEEAYEMIKKNPNVVVIDVRSEEEYRRGHIDGAINIELSLNFERDVAKLDKNSTILVYCNTGLKSRVAAELLVRVGFKRVYNLVGGIKEWEARGLPVVK